MWTPANSRIGANNLKKAIDSADGYRPQPNLNAEGYFGKITKIGGDYVKKSIDLRRKNQNSNLEKVFMNEIRVGSMAGMFPRIYAWRIKKQQGKPYSAEYIMDDFRIAPPGFKVVLMREFLEMKYGDTCPAASEPIYARLKEAILKFWKTSKGYHGDLHVGNMAVMYNTEDKSVKKVIIFDYGSHRRFKTSTNSETCFEKFIQIIDKEFSNSIKGVKQRYHPQGTQILAAIPRNNQAYRSNTSMLRGLRLTQQSKIINKNFSTSMMSRIHPNNKAPNIPKPSNTPKLTRKPNELLVKYKKEYSRKSNIAILEELIKAFSNFNYNRNKATGQLNFPNMSKENYRAMVHNLSTLLKEKQRRRR